MDEYRHILVALDLTDESDQVAKRARLLGDRCGSRISLAHVVEYVPMAYSGDLVLPDDFNLEQELLEVARRRMTALGERLGVPEADRHVVLGAIAAEIVRLVQETRADLIVVGSHGRHGLAILLGSTANAILHHAPCDLLAVRIRESSD
jgi:universal stress protein A